MSKLKESKLGGPQSPLLLATTESFKELVREVVREEQATGEGVETSKKGLQVHEERSTDENVQNKPSNKKAKSRLKQVVFPDEIPRYHELGLGRGVDVTDADMWKSKTPYLVRVACEGNIIGTQECEILESYKKEVSTFENQRQKLWLSLDNPVGSQVKIGIDEQSSRSSSSTKLIEGEKIETRTISFQFHFDDVPLYDNIDQAVVEAPNCFLHQSDNNWFENDLANWFLKRIKDREIKQLSKENSDAKNDSSNQDSEENKETSADENSLKETSADGNSLKETSVDGNSLKETSVDENSAIIRLVEELNNQTRLSDIAKDCLAFLKHLGVTHYVSAIKLGACEYHVVSSRVEETRLGASSTVASGSLVKGGLSGILEKKFSFKGEESQKIGRINSDKEVTTEAVIGFEIQPIYKLVRIQFIQMCLRKAIKEYIKSKENKGPFLISSQIEKKAIFWKVEHSERLQLVGTDSWRDASLFHIIPIGDPTHPSEFHIAYYTRGRQYTMHVDDLYRTYNVLGPPLPHYLSTDTDIVGKSRGSLSLETCTEIKKARFSLHSRVQSSFACMCTSTPVDLCSWLDGEQFYIKCSYHSTFKVDGYVAIEKENDDGNAYKVITVFSAARKDPVKTGMLFRLHPEAIKEHGTNTHTDTDTPEDKSTSPEEPSADPVEQSSPQLQSPPADPVEQSSPQLQSCPADSAKESTQARTLPSTHATLPQQLLILAIIFGATGMLMFSIYRAFS